MGGNEGTPAISTKSTQGQERREGSFGRRSRVSLETTGMTKEAKGQGGFVFTEARLFREGMEGIYDGGRVEGGEEGLGKRQRWRRGDRQGREGRVQIHDILEEAKRPH